MTDAERQRHSGSADKKEDYFAYNQPILAPADGEVVRVRDKVRDNPYVGAGLLDWLSRDFRGNFVVIEHAAQAEYSFLTHLVPGSITVQRGQRVLGGQVIGRCGHSGHSTEPHLHFRVQDYPNVFLAVGLPVKFAEVLVDESKSVASWYLKAGMEITPATSKE